MTYRSAARLASASADAPQAIQPLPADAVSPTARKVYAARAAYAFDEAEVFVSNKRVAADIEVSVRTVVRANRELEAAGWQRIKERVWSPISGWTYNVIELIAPFTVSDLAGRRIVQRAHRRARYATRVKRAFAERRRNPFRYFGRAVPEMCRTNRRETTCPCPQCQPDRPNTWQRGSQRLLGSVGLTGLSVLQQVRYENNLRATKTPETATKLIDELPWNSYPLHA